MSENGKTIGFLAVAVVILGVAWATRPAPFTVDLNDEIGKVLNSGDPLAATSMEIIKFDEETGDTKPFKVAQIEGLWSLPSHLNYPADAEGQLAEAAASVMDLKVLNVIQAPASDHALYGVVDPATAKPGATGVGTRVTLEDRSGKQLAQFVIGKEVKDRPTLRYLRIPSQDVVYEVEVSTDKLSTKFEDWIEDDLLKLNSFDIQQVVLNNYSVDEVQGVPVPGELLDLTYDDKTAKWSLAGLADNEELNTTKLNDLKNALDDLKIVDVRRKPAGLSQELRSEEGVTLDQQAIVSLAQHGFYLDNGGRLLSNEGEAICRLKDGVEYVLRFGEIAAGTEDGGNPPQGDAAEADEQAAGEDSNPKGSNRYIFVMARVAEEMIPKPELEPLPGDEGPVPASPVENPEDGAAAENTEGEEPAAPADEQPTDQPKSDSDSAESSDEASGGDDDPQAAESETATEGQPAEEAAGETAEDAPTEEAASDETKPASPAESADEAPADDKPAEPTAEELQAERERIEKENQRKQDEYNNKLKKAQEKVRELNDRFADWYYVISDDIFRKIHLNRADIVQPKEGEAAGPSTGPDEATLESFNELRQGIDGGNN